MCSLIFLIKFTKKGKSLMEKEKIPSALVRKWGLLPLREGWTNVPNTLLMAQSKLGITNSEMMLLIHIMSFAHKPDSLVFPSIATLAASMNQHERTIQRTLGRLIKKQLITKTVHSKNASDIGLTNTYNLDPLKAHLSKIKKSE